MLTFSEDKSPLGHVCMVWNANKAVLTQQSDSIAGINIARFGVSSMPGETVL